LNALGWRAIFWMMLVLVGAVLARTALRLPETLPKTRRQPLHPRVLWANYSQALRTSDFLLVERDSYAQLRGNLHLRRRGTHLSRRSLGLSTYGFAWFFVPLISGIMTGVVFLGQLAGRLSPNRTIRIGYACMFAGAFFNLLVVAFV